MDTVPTLVVSFPDELSEREALIMANRTRPKTREQQLKEYQELKDVAEIRANNRKMAALKQNQSPMSDTENFPGREEEKGEARDIAAAKIGLSGKTAEKGSEILEAVEILKEEGKAEAAPPVSTPLPGVHPVRPKPGLPPRTPSARGKAKSDKTLFRKIFSSTKKTKSLCQ